MAVVLSTILGVLASHSDASLGQVHQGHPLRASSLVIGRAAAREPPAIANKSTHILRSRLRLQSVVFQVRQ